MRAGPHHVLVCVDGIHGNHHYGDWLSVCMTLSHMIVVSCELIVCNNSKIFIVIIMEQNQLSMSLYSLRAATGSSLISIASLSFLHVLSSSLATQCLRTDIRRLMALCLSAKTKSTCPPCCKPVARSSHFVGGKPCFSMRYAALLVSSTIGMEEEHYLLSLDMKWLLV